MAEVRSAMMRRILSLPASASFRKASGASLIQQSTVIMNDAVLTIYKQSQLVRLMINNYNVWFSLPAIAFVISSFFGNEETANV